MHTDAEAGFSPYLMLVSIHTQATEEGTYWLIMEASVLVLDRTETVASFLLLSSFWWRARKRCILRYVVSQYSMIYSRGYSKQDG